MQIGSALIHKWLERAQESTLLAKMEEFGA